jgi:hypothetical protein
MAYKIKSVLSLHTLVVFKLFGWPVILIASVKIFTNSETCTICQIKIHSGLRYLSRVSFLHMITFYWTGKSGPKYACLGQFNEQFL